MTERSMDEITTEVRTKIGKFPVEKLFYKLKIYSKKGTSRGVIRSVEGVYFRSLIAVLSLYEVGVTSFTASMVGYFTAKDDADRINVWGAMHRLEDNHVLILLRKPGVLTWKLNPAFIKLYYEEPKTQDSPD